MPSPQDIALVAHRSLTRDQVIRQREIQSELIAQQQIRQFGRVLDRSKGFFGAVGNLGSFIAKNPQGLLVVAAPVAAPLLGLTAPTLGGTLAKLGVQAATRFATSKVESIQRDAARAAQSRQTGGQPVSLLADLAKFATGVGTAATQVSSAISTIRRPSAAAVLPGAGPTIIRPSGQMMTAGFAPMLPAIGGTVARQLPGVLGGAAAGLALDRFGNPVKKRRRMNPMNVKAARRAIRRIKAVRKITRDIEKQLPTRTVTRTRTVPSGHRARLSHK